MLLTNTGKEKLHKDRRTPRHFLWLRKFLRCRLGEIWKDSEKTLPFSWLHTLYSFWSICHKPCLASGCWAGWSSGWLAGPILMLVVFLVSCGWYLLHSPLRWFRTSCASRLTGFTSLTEAQPLMKCVWRVFCGPWASANSNSSQWVICRGLQILSLLLKIVFLKKLLHLRWQ